MIWIIGSRGLPARYGGFETLAEHLAEGFAARGVTCQVIGTQDGGGYSQRAIRSLKRVGLHGAVTPLATWASRPAAGADDSVLVLNPVNVWTALWIRRRGARVVLHMDGMEHLRPKWGRTARALHRLARWTAVRSDLTLIADSREIQRIFLDEFGRETEYVAYGGCDRAEADGTHRWTPERAGDHYLVMARPEPENQVLAICEAFAATNVRARLLVVGGPNRPNPYWREIERVASSDPRIELLGPIWDRDRLCELMMTARAYVHGHTVGGTNPSLVDVLSHGTPVLAHDNAFNREVVGPSALCWQNPRALTTLLERAAEPTPRLASPGALLWPGVIDAYVLLLHRPDASTLPVAPDHGVA